MLNQTPPSTASPTTNSMNQQNNGLLGNAAPNALGQYFANFYNSSYAVPSSFSMPSSVDAPQSYYQQQAPQQSNSPVTQMVAALRG